MFSFKLLLAQIAIILSAARLLGWLFRKLHQPRVIGEMLAGILLGPSLLGWAAPDLSAALFPASSLPALGALSQLGLLLFMFLIGLELDLKQVRELGRVAIVTSLASIVIPFGFGSLLATALYPLFAEPHINRTAFILFIGTAISITAFPVLARILAERDLLRTRVGALALTCAAINDTAAWCMLAGIVALVRASDLTWPLWQTLLALTGFVVFMFVVAKPTLQRLVPLYAWRQELSHDILALIFLTVLLAGWVTEALGVHALFGAFLAGLVMPRDADMSQALWLRIEALIVVLLLPLYFALTGLRSSVFLISGARWLICAVIIGTAIVGKLGGSTLAARVSGLSWREATAVGILLNTHGMVELVILNIGLDLGIIPPALFSIMVLMALVTTLMAAPLLSLVYRERPTNQAPV